MRLNFTLFYPALAVAIMGCSTPYSPVSNLLPIQTPVMVSSTADLSQVIATNPNNPVFICAMPPPDAVFSQSDNADFSLLAYKGAGTDNTKATESSEGNEMSGRTPGVLLARELFYRVCELSRNNNIEKSQAIELFNKTLEAVTKIMLTESKNTRITTGKTLQSVNSRDHSSAANGVSLGRNFPFEQSNRTNANNPFENNPNANNPNANNPFANNPFVNNPNDSGERVLDE